MGFMDSIIDAGKNILGGNANVGDLLGKLQGNASSLLGAAGTESFLNSAKTAVSSMSEGNKVELSSLFGTALSAMGKSSPETNAGSPVEMITSAIKTFIANDPNFLQNILGSLTSMGTQSAEGGANSGMISNLLKSPVAIEFFKNTFAGLMKH
jgi:hypothetical protein